MYETATPLAPTTTGARLGERVRTLRVSAGLTQTQLAGTRFSKEYISQIERGKTRPTESTVAWLADRLGVDPVLLSSGISTEDRANLEATLTRAEALSAAQQYDDAVEAYRADPAERGGHCNSIARATPADRRSLGSARGRPGEGSDRAAAASTGDRGAWRLLGSRSRRRPLPTRSLSVQALERVDRDRAVRRGALARRAFGSAVRPAPLGHPAAALALSPPAA